jgi:hypothetical protein
MHWKPVAQPALFMQELGQVASTPSHA